MLKRKLANNEQNSVEKKQNECISLREKDVFVSEYLNSLTGFNGILKKRYSDFHVNEIDLDGNVIKLTDLTIPQFTSFIPPLDLQSAPVTCLLADYQRYQLHELLEKKEDNANVRFEVSHLNKTQRQNLHHLIRDEFGLKLVTKTVSTTDDRKFIEISLAPTNAILDRNSWIDTLPQYLHFVVYKENMDTTEAINIIATQLRIKSNMVMHAGTKDKRAKTVQRMAIRRMNLDKFRGNKFRNMRIGNFAYKDVPIKLGDLRGNRFRIILRNLSIDDGELTDIMISFKNNGFINYFGMQRFGSNVESPTYEIGKCLVRKEWKRAIELILSPRQNDWYDLMKAKKTWVDEKDSRAAFKCLGRNRGSIEGKVLQALSHNGETAYVNALQKIPRNVMFLYGHSYQSLIWNRIISRRIKEFGRTPICGDLIFVNNEKSIAPLAVEESESDQSSIFTEADIDDHKLKNLVRPITEDELSGVKIEDIVYPLPGYDIKYPENVVAKWYREILDEDGITIENFKQSSWLFSIPGGYRKMITMPEDLIWKTLKYENPDNDLILSDSDVLLNKELPENGIDGQYKALYLELSLPSSCYATMAIRELTKQDTSISYQSSLVAEKPSKTDQNLPVGQNNDGDSSCKGD